MIRLLNKVLNSYLWTSVGREAHNNMPKILFANSINFCLKEQSGEKHNSIKSLRGFLHYISMDNKHGFLLTKTDISVLVKSLSHRN